MKIKANFKFFITLAFVATSCGVSFGQQVCPSNLVSTAPNSRYTVQANSAEVRDDSTGLVWQRCTVGQSWSGTACTGASASYTWALALAAANTAGASGGFSWRLPNIKEALSLMEWSCTSPSLNASMYPDTTTNQYWTSTSDESTASSTQAWAVRYNVTVAVPPTNPAYAVQLVSKANGSATSAVTMNIRLVRSSQ